MVSVSRLDSRLINTATWDAAPPSNVRWDAAFNAYRRPGPNAEGDTGWLHNRVLFDDGHVHDIDAWDGIGASASLNVSVLRWGGVTIDPLELIAPTASETLWQARVAVGASRTCGPLLHVAWRPCGNEMATGETPVFLELPGPISCTPTASSSMLTDPADAAALSPVNKPTSTTLCRSPTPTARLATLRQPRQSLAGTAAITRGSARLHVQVPLARRPEGQRGERGGRGLHRGCRPSHRDL